MNATYPTDHQTPTDSAPTQADGPFKSEVREGMRVDWDVPMRMRDGTLVRMNIYRPIDGSRKVGTICSSGVYAKDLSVMEGYPGVWDKMVKDIPELLEGSSNVHQNWEVADPEQWVRDGFAVVRIDARGIGTSEGWLDPFGPQEREDFAEVIERLAHQPWSNGNIGVTGISYYAMTAWGVAALNPPSLKAIAVWEGAVDFYRDAAYHGGILSRLTERWYPNQVQRIQHGKRGFKSVVTGASVTGELTLTDAELRNNRFPLQEELARNKLDGPLYESHSVKTENIRCAVLSAGNWGGQGLHLRGNIEGFLDAGSTEKFLEMHGLEHWTHFYTPYGMGLLKRYFGHYLNGLDTGWKQQPRVSLNVRAPGDRFSLRAENEWPLARTEWTRLYLDPQKLSLGATPTRSKAEIAYDPLGSGGVTFRTTPLTQPMEITGPLAAKLFVSSSTTDADLFLVVRVFDPRGQEVLFRGTADPHTPVAQGWLRASHRHLDPERSLHYRPYHTHDRLDLLQPGEVVELDIEIWPTCLVIPAGHTLALSIRGKDYDFAEDEPGSEEAGYAGTVLQGMRGCGPFVHNSNEDRPEAIFGGTVRLHVDAERQAFLQLPVIPRA
jgi:uncharacterized protein